MHKRNILRREYDRHYKRESRIRTHVDLRTRQQSECFFVLVLKALKDTHATYCIGIVDVQVMVLAHQAFTSRATRPRVLATTDPRDARSHLCTQIPG